MLKSRIFSAAIVIGALAPAFFLPTASGQQKGGGKQKGNAGPPAPMPAILQNYQPVTAERLLKPEDGNWPMIRRTYDGWGYSPLDQITPANVARLQLVWSSTTGEGRAHEAAPVVNNGVMFITTPNNQVIAFDGATGTILWRYRRPRPQGAIVPHEVNRGVALYGDKVYVVRRRSGPGRAGRQDRHGSLDHDRRRQQIRLLHHARSADRGREGSGGRFGRRIRNPRLRGGVRCRDRQRSLAHVHRSRARRTRQRDVARGGDQWKTGGAPVWVTGNYDPETNLAFFGTGNGGPTIGDNRPGDNLYTASTIAFDVATGAIKGYHQYHPNDSWDYDEVSPPILVDYQRNGRTIKGLIDVARDGYLWFLERSAGPIKFVEGKPYVFNNVIRGRRSGHGPSRYRSGAQARHQRAGRILPRRPRRQDLAADFLQSQDAHDLHPGQQQHLRTQRRRSECHLHGRAGRSSASRAAFLR